MFIFVFVFMNCVKSIIKYYKPITVQYSRAHCLSWVPRLTWLEQIGLANVLPEWNSFVSRKLTVEVSVLAVDFI